MSVARVGSLPDSHKYYTVSVDSLGNWLFRGQVFHESLDYGLVFENITEMIYLLEDLFDEQGYPMKSVDRRHFNKAPLNIKAHKCQVQDKECPESGKQTAVFQLCVKHRYHATWQGDIKNMGDGKTYAFLSLLELIGYLNRELGNKALLPGPKEQEGVTAPRTFTVKSGCGATFVVRVLFYENATWQGTVFWEEEGCEVHFRSFMELLLLMQEATGGGKDNQGR